VIREATAADDVAVGELLVRAFVDTYAVKMPQVVVSERRRAELRDVAPKRAAAKVWVAEEGGQVTGTVALWPPGSEKSEAWLPGAYDLRHLAVDASLRKSGLSAALLDTAEAYAKAAFGTAVCLHVRHGATGLARMYMARGYARAPEGDIEHPEVMLEAYVKRL
jgi:predicted N-acetyltransferase YhbS